MDIVEWMGPPLVKIFFLLFKTQWKEFLLAVGIEFLCTSVEQAKTNIRGSFYLH